MKKKLAATLSVVLILGLAVLGILAYLQDDDSDVNVMKLGNVDIEQTEYDADENEVINGNFGDLYPGMEVVKRVKVENVGESSAYVRTIVAFETLDKEKYPTFGYTPIWENEATYNVVTQITKDGVLYDVYEIVFEAPLEPGDVVYSLNKVELNTTCTNEDMAALGGNYEVVVLSQAVQTAGFERTAIGVTYCADEVIDTAEEALDEAFGEVSATNVLKWFEKIFKYVNVDGEKVSVEGEAAAEILTDLTAGKDLIVDEDTDIIAFDTNEVDAQGATVTLNGQGPEAYGYLAFMPDAGENVTLSNLNVTGSGFVCVGYYGQGGGTYELNNVNIENFASTLKNVDKGFNLACAFMHYGNATLNNCVMTGTTAIQEGAMPVDLACANGFTTVVNGGEYGTIYCWSNGWTTINGAEVDTMYVAPIKGTVTIKAGSHVGTLNIDYGIYAEKYADGSKLSQLVIEDGAIVDKIVFNGTTYTLAEWNAR